MQQKSYHRHLKTASTFWASEKVYMCERAFEIHKAFLSADTLICSTNNMQFI